MPSALHHRALWTPVTAQDRGQVLQEMEAILSSSHFCNSKRYPALLRYVVQHALDGDVSNIKERTLGIEVFGRSADYDTNADTIVRYTAGEVRRRLATYYHEHDDTRVQIVLPIGSYTPEFYYLEEDAAPSVIVPDPPSALPVGEPLPPATVPTERKATRHLGRWAWLLPPLLVVLALGIWWPVHARESETAALDRFWAPVISEKKMPLVVTGGVVFSSNTYSGTQTADRTAEYPFVSMQIASALARVSGLLQRKGGDIQILPANTTTLSDLRDRPVILVGAYNNDWTVRLSQSTPFHLAPASQPSILDSANANQRWERDHKLPYAASDDFALVGRYRDSTTGSLTVIIAGMGRNGTEAAAQFLTDPRYMKSLEDRMGRRIDEHNLEAVLKVSVIQGRTGAPSIAAVRTW